MPEVNLYPGTPVKLTGDKKRTLAGVLCEYIADLERINLPYFNNIKTWWDNYNAQPISRIKNFPFKNASNIIVPVCQVHVDAAAARTWGKIFGGGHRIWEGTTENEQLEDSMRQVLRYLNWQANGNDFDFPRAAYDWIQEFEAIGSSVIAGNYRTDTRAVFIPGSRKPQAISFARGPLLEHVPREQILWDTHTPIQEAPAVTREFHYAWSQLASIANQARALPGHGGWDLDAIQDIRQQGGPQSASNIVREGKDRAADRPQNAFIQDNTHEVYEIHIDWPMLNAMGIDGQDLATPGNVKINTVQIPLVVTLHRKAMKILRIVGEPYAAPYKPFFDGYHHRRPGQGNSPGLVKKTEGMQAGITTIVNQQIDAQTRANSVWAKTGNARHLNEPIDPSTPIYDPDGTFTPLTLPGGQFSNIQTVQLIQSWAERLSGQSDPAFGRETRLGGHSAPATTTLALLQQGETLNSPQHGALNTIMSRMGEFVAILDQQFESGDQGKIDRVLGAIDGEKVSSILFPTDAIPGNFNFRVQGLTPDQNPEQRLNSAVAVSQMNAQYWSQVLTATQSYIQLQQVQDPVIQALNKEAFTGFLKSTTKAYSNFLEAADIDDVETYVLSIAQQRGELTQPLEQLSNFAGEQLGTSQPGAQPGVAPNQRPPTGGSNESFAPSAESFRN